MNPWLMLGALISSLALFAGGYGMGTYHAVNACTAGQAKSQLAAQVKADAVSVKREEVAQSRETSREQIRIVYRTIKENAHENPVADCGLDADGLRLWNAANAGTTATLFGEPDYSLSGAAAGAVGQAGGSAGQPHRGDGAVRAVPGSVGQAGGM